VLPALSEVPGCDLKCAADGQLSGADGGLSEFFQGKLLNIRGRVLHLYEEERFCAGLWTAG